MLQRNLVTSLLLYEQVRTTKKRAQVIAPLVDRLVAVAKKAPPHNAIRAINRVVTDRNASRKIMEVFVKRFASIPSGLTRMVPVGARKGDGASLVDLELVEGQQVTVRSKKAEEKKAKGKGSTRTTVKA
jgi:ribosomal protein L17